MLEPLHERIMKNSYIGIIVIVLMVFGYVGFRAMSPNSDNQQANTLSSSQDEEVLRFEAVISGRSYEPDRIEVPLGATVELTVKNEDNEQHGLFFSEFGVQDVVRPRSTKTIRFTANRLGETSSFCSVAHPEKLIIVVI